MTDFALESRLTEAADGPLVIGEVGQAHDGSLGTAHAYIDVIADAGAHAVKFQTHFARYESTPHEPWRVQFSKQDATRYDYWKRMEFTDEQWLGLREHANMRGIAFISSPFSVEAVELLANLKVDALKIASGELGNKQLLQACGSTGLPVFISSGMSDWTEIDLAVEIIAEAGSVYGLMQCTSSYPCPPESWGLNVLPEMRDRYDCPVGLSDHSGEIFAGLAATALGAQFIEVHVTLSKKAFGPDVSASLTPKQLSQLCLGAPQVAQALRHPVNKDAMADALLPMRSLFTRSVVATRDLSAGHVLSVEDLALKKPGTGIPGAEIARFYGKRLVASVMTDQLLSWDDIDA